MNRPLTHALLCAAAFFTHAAASAGELTLFEDDNFRGRAVTVRDTTDDLSRVGFNDKASSIMVRSGTWDVCTDSGFRGSCKTLTPGEYRSMPGMNDAISSVREVGRNDGRSDGRNDWRNDGRNDDRNDGRNEWRDDGRHQQHGQQQRSAVLLFPDANLRGEPVAIDRNTEDLVRYHFNDRAGSIVVNEGQWEVCSDSNFRGRCEVIGPGQYARLNALDNKISSLRRVR